MHISTKQLVASRGRVGSNPTPGAFSAHFLLISCSVSAKVRSVNRLYLKGLYLGNLLRVNVTPAFYQMKF